MKKVLVMVIVLAGLVVHYNKKIYPPGKGFLCDEDEAKRLRNAGKVRYADKTEEGEAAPVTLDELTDRQRQLMAAITELDPDKKNKEHWTRSKLPRTEALSEITGDEVSAAERSEAYDLYLRLEEKEAEK